MFRGRKAKSNEATHGIAFEKAITAFDDPFALVAADPGHLAIDLSRRRRWRTEGSSAGISGGTRRSVLRVEGG